MFIAGMSEVLETPVNDLWTVLGQEGALAEWRAEDEAFFKNIDSTWRFFARQIEDFSAAAREDRPPAVTGRDGREAVRLMEGIYESGWIGGPVRPRACGTDR